jgi:hypothetical protein
LNTDRNRNRYPEFTNYSAHQKPFLLLSIIDLIAQKKITENFIAPSFFPKKKAPGLSGREGLRMVSYNCE